MIKVVQGDRQTCQSFVEDLKSRVGQTSPEIEASVRDIIEAVRTGGDQAVKEFSKRFDGWTPETLELSKEALEQAVEIAAGLMREQGMSASEAAKTASQQTGLKKGDIYKGALALK